MTTEPEVTMPESDEAKFDSWAIVDLLGHLRYAGKVTEINLFGTVLGRVDVPRADGGWTTVYFSGSSLHSLIPTTEEAARLVARRAQPEPVHAWELPRPEGGATRTTRSLDHAYEDDRDDEDHDLRFDPN